MNSCSIEAHFVNVIVSITTLMKGMEPVVTEKQEFDLRFNYLTKRPATTGISCAFPIW